MTKQEKTIEMLIKFYKNEESGLGHYEDDLVELAWALAEVLEEEGPDCNIWKGYEEDFYAMIEDLRKKHDVTTIDTAVNHMHQGLLDALDRSGGDSTDMMCYHEGDIRSYLLSRE